MASLGDLDGDGSGDYAVGAPGDRGAIGCVWIVSGARGVPLLHIDGPPGARFFGWKTCALGDLDGDERLDLAVLSMQGRGVIRAYSSTSGKVLFEIEGAFLERTLNSCASAGDLNGDGLPDLVCAPAPVTGRVQLFSGRDGCPLGEFEGGQVLALMPYYKDPGSSGDVTACGDLDGDDFPDLLVSIDGGPHKAHRAAVLSGKDGTPLFLIDVSKERGAYGSRVASAGDIDGDSIPDLAIATPHQVTFTREENVPRATVTIYSGKDGSVLLRPRFPRAGLGFGFGRSMVSAGDVNGDGNDDVVVAAHGINAGIVLCSGTDGRAVHFWPSGWVLRRGFGESLAALQDVDQDGVQDVAIGVANWNSPTAPGAVLVCSGKSGRELYEISTETLRGGAPGVIQQSQGR